MADWLPLAISVAGLTVSLVAVVVAFVLRMRDRREPASLPQVAVAAFGVATSLGIHAIPTSGPAIALMTVGIPTGLLVLAGAYRWAGILLVGAALPSAAIWSAVAAIAWVAPGTVAAPDLPVGLATSLTVAAVGIAGIAIGDRSDRRAPVPADAPDPARITALARALLGELRFGPADLPNLVTLVVVVALSAVVALVSRAAGLDAALTTVLVAAVLPIVGTDLFYRVWPPRIRRAMGVHAYLGSWELARFRREVGGATPGSPAAARRWLASHPETDANRWVRPEIMALAGELAEADAVVACLPMSTEAERFERRSLEVLMDIVAGRQPDLAALAAEAERVGAPDSGERRRAVAAVALAEARHRLVRRAGDWIEPLVRASDRIGPAGFDRFRRDTMFVRFVVLTAIAALGAVALLPFTARPA